MKKSLFVFIAASFIAVSAQAQDQPQVSPDKKEVKLEAIDWEKKFKDELRLNEEQTVRYDALNKEYKEKIDAVLKDASLSKEVQKEKKMALKKEKEARLFEILSPEQQAKYKELKEQKEKQHATSKQGS